MAGARGGGVGGSVIHTLNLVVGVVSKVVNPYRQWLGLDTDAQSLNYYELLNLPLFEGDAEKIHRAADRALVRVRGQRPGARAVAWARLLDELAQAKACLGDPAKKSSYDAALRAQLHADPEGGAHEQNERPATFEIAEVNQEADLFPPGMGAAASKSPSTTPETVPQAESKARDGSAPERKALSDGSGSSLPPAGDVNNSNRKKQPLSGAADTVERAGHFLQDPFDNVAPDYVGLAEIPDHAPVNAHVAPPRKQGTSLLPLAITIGVALSVVTLAVLLLTWQRGFFRSVGDAPALSETGRPAAKQDSPDAAASPENGWPSAASSSQNPGQTTAVERRQPGSSKGTNAAREDVPRASSTTPPADETESAAVAEHGVSGRQAPKQAPTPRRLETNDSAAATSPPPEQVERTRLSETLEAARAALSQHDFELAGEQLAEAERLAVRPEDQAVVAGLRELRTYSRKFWQTVASVMKAFQGAEELAVGSGGLVVLVVETGPDFITVRKEGRNLRYSLLEMPPGLALAIAKTQLKGYSAQDLMQLGACLATTANRKRIYREEARKYWLRAHAAGADVDRLLLTLRDDVESAE